MIPGGICRPPGFIQIERGDASVGFHALVTSSSGPVPSWLEGGVSCWWWFRTWFYKFVNPEWHCLMPFSPPLLCHALSLQKLWQCVAGASVMFGRGALVVVPAVRDSVSLVEGIWRLDEGNVGGGGGWNAGRSGSEGRECEGRGGEWRGKAPGGDGVVRGVARWRRWLSAVILAMWNQDRVSVLMRAGEPEDACPWCSCIVDLIKNWPSCAACSLVRTAISWRGSTKVISIADHENTKDLIMERYVTDLRCPGNDVTVSCSSAILKYANAGRERQRTAMQQEPLVDGASLQQKVRRSFILMLLIESRVGQDRLYKPQICSATFKEQVFDAQSLRLVEDYGATSSQPEVLRHRQPCLYRGLNNTSFQSLMILSLTGWRSIWTLWHSCLLQLICCSFSNSVNEAWSYNNSWISEESFFCKSSHFW